MISILIMEKTNMATADQIKNLINAHNENDDEHFKTIVLQIAANEARLKHGTLARELKKLAECKSKAKFINFNNTQISSLFTPYASSFNLNDLIVSDKTQERIDRILNEYRHKNSLYKYGLSNRRKILIEGKPGTGKTLTASVIANELSLPLYTVPVDKLVTKFMGETSVKLRQIFDVIDSQQAVYLFDEFDAIGSDRSLDNEVGEMRRILNSFLQFIEQDNSTSIIIAATNNQKLLDKALFRRFDDVLHYSMPTRKEIMRLYQYKLSIYQENFEITDDLITATKGLSHAEITKVCDDAIKSSILSNTEITEQKVKQIVKERLSTYNKQEA
jgi:SpoVK/Ycf46/Vps4 family AAA+-type ATPase